MIEEQTYLNKKLLIFLAACAKVYNTEKTLPEMVF
jgi:hypothetical protein